MLPYASRMRRGPEFTAVTRSGRRAGGFALTGHLLLRAGSAEPPRVGLVVSRAVGGAVVRNLVRRRLREHLRPRLDRLPPGSLLVVRANPRAAGVGHRELGADLDRILDRLLRQQTRAPTT